MTTRTLVANRPAPVAAGARLCGFGAGQAFAGVAARPRYQWLPMVISDSMVRTDGNKQDTHPTRRLSESPT